MKLFKKLSLPVFLYSIITIISSNAADRIEGAANDLGFLENGKYLIRNNYNKKYLFLSNDTRFSSDYQDKDKVVKVRDTIGKDSIFTFKKDDNQGWLIQGFDSRYVHVCKDDKSNGHRMIEASNRIYNKCYFKIMKYNEGYIIQSEMFKEYIYAQSDGNLALSDNEIRDQSYFKFIVYDQDLF